MDRNAADGSAVCLCGVALRKESVDRKAVDPPGRAHYYWSLSARRAWIEKTLRLTLYLSIMVALRKESVDRNLVMWTRCPSTTSRSPQGERG